MRTVLRCTLFSALFWFGCQQEAPPSSDAATSPEAALEQSSAETPPADVDAPSVQTAVPASEEPASTEPATQANPSEGPILPPLNQN